MSNSLTYNALSPIRAELQAINARIDALVTASIELAGEVIPPAEYVIQEIPQSPVIVPFITDATSNDTSIIDADDLANTLEAKAEGRYNGVLNINFKLTTVLERNVTLYVVDNTTNNVLYSFPHTLIGQFNETKALNLSNLFDFVANTTIRFEISCDGNNVELTSFALTLETGSVS
jgi:hypothetical protein